MLFKTLVNKQKIEEVRIQLDFEYCFVVGSFERSRGIGILLRRAKLCTMVNYSTKFVALDVHDGNYGI